MINSLFFKSYGMFKRSKCVCVRMWVCARVLVHAYHSLWATAHMWRVDGLRAWVPGIRLRLPGSVVSTSSHCAASPAWGTLWLLVEHQFRCAVQVLGESSRCLPIVSWIPEEPLVSHWWVFLSTFQILVITLETAPFVPSALWFFKLWVTVEFTCSFSFCWVDSVLFFC